MIIVLGSGHSNTVTSVTDNLGTHLAWASRGSVDQSGHQRISEYWATFSAGGTITITVSFGSSDTNLCVVAFGISGANTNTGQTFDGSLRTAYASSAGAPSVTGVSTTNAHDMIIGLEGSRSATIETAGTSFTLIKSITSTAGNGAAENNVATSALSGATVSFGTSTSSDWAMIVDAVQRAW